MTKEQPQIISLSYKISNDMLVYPGDPEVKIEDYQSIESGGCRLKKISFGTHTGTHMDTPAHMLKNGCNLDDLSEIKFLGVARCLKVENQDLAIGPENIPSDLHPEEAIFLHTGHSVSWNTKKFYEARPFLSDEALDLLVKSKISALGIDTPSVDPKGSKDKNVHEKLLGSNIIIYESLANLDKLPVNEAFVYLAVPLPLAEADGSPLNILALLGDKLLVDSVLNFKNKVSRK